MHRGNNNLAGGDFVDNILVKSLTLTISRNTQMLDFMVYLDPPGCLGWRVSFICFSFGPSWVCSVDFHGL